MKSLHFLAAIVVASLPAIATAGTIDFYEGEKGTQTKHCTLKDDKNQSYNLKKDGAPCPNDDVVSVVLRDVKAGTVIELFDDPDGDATKDDYCKIVVVKPKNEYTINHLEMESHENEYIKFTYGKDNGLNGKVSHIKITIPTDE